MISATLALLAVVVWPSVALAHAVLLRSDPPDGAVLGAAPSQVRLWFSEPLALTFTTFELVDGDGRPMPLAGVRSDAASLVAERFGAADPPASLLIDLPPLAPNVYRLSWRALSNNDPHITSGSIVFGVQHPADLTPAAAVAPAPPPLEVGLRWLSLGALALLIGALAVAMLATTDHRPPTNDQRPTTIGDRPTTDHRGSPAGTKNREPRTRSWWRAIQPPTPNPQPPSPISHRLLRLAFGSALLALAAETGQLLAQAGAGGSETASSVAGAIRIIGGTGFGARWLCGQGLLVALGLAIRLLLNQNAHTTLTPPSALITPPLARPTSPQTVPPTPHTVPTTPYAALLSNIGHKRRLARAAPGALAVALILGLAVVRALNSHAAAFNDLSAARILAAALHLLAAGLWTGGVVALALAVVPLLHGDQEETALAWAIMQRFGALAATALAALLISGLFMSGQQVASLDALLTTLYGRTLILKVTLALGVAALGLHNAAALHHSVAATLRRLWPQLRRGRDLSASQPCQRASEEAIAHEGRLARTVTIEATGALALLLLAAVLSETPPARGPQFDPPAEAAATPASTISADDLLITLDVKPNRPGRNFLSLGVLNTRRPAPAPIEAVMIQLVAPRGGSSGRRTDALLVAEPLGGKRYQIAGDHMNVAGDWQIGVIIKRQGMPDTLATIPWVVPLATPPIERRPILVSNQPLAPALTHAAAWGALLLAGVALALWLRRRHLATVALSQSFLTRRHLRPLRKE